MDVNLRVVARQWMEVSPRAGGARRTNINLKVITIQQTDGNPRAGSAHSHRQNPIRVKGHVEDLHATEEVLTIFEGPNEAGNSRQPCDRYPKKARHPPQALVHKADTRPTSGTLRGPEDIVFKEADAKWVHHPNTNAMVINVKIANNIIHRMLVDNGRAANILF